MREFGFFVDAGRAVSTPSFLGGTMVDPQATKFWRVALQSGLVDAEGLKACWEALPAGKQIADQLDRRLARQAIQAGLVTLWQAQQLLAGRFSGYHIDRYVLLDLIGQGGMGRVYRAKDKRLNRQVALKLLSPERVNIPRAILRFQREARVGAQLQHENLVRIYDEGASNGKCYLVMEYIEGKNVGQLIAESGTMPPILAARLARQVALGLQHAQQKGLIHRDVNPCNILVTRDGTAKLTDLGLAIDLADQAQVTRDGATVGTFDYISPEQARHSHSVDTRSDIYSLGCTLYHMIAGRVPFPAPSLMEKLLAHQTGVPDPLEELAPGIPEGLSDVVRRMMQKLPDDRYTTPLAVAQALETFAYDLAPTIDGEVDAVLGRGAGGRRVVTSRTKITPPPGVPEPTAAVTEVPTPQMGRAPDNGVPPMETVEDTRADTSDDELLRAVLPLDFRPRPPSQEVAKAKAARTPGNSWSPDLALAIGLAGVLLTATLGYLGFVKWGSPWRTTTGAPPPESNIPGRPEPEPMRGSLTRTTTGAPPPGANIPGRPKPKPRRITVLAADGTTTPEPDLFAAVRRAIGSRGEVVIHGDDHLPLSISTTELLSGGRIVIRAAEGSRPVLDVEIRGPNSLLATGRDASLTLIGLTILAHYTEKGNGELPALIQAGRSVTLERCAFMVAGDAQGTRALSNEGSELTATGCWFEGFGRALDVEAYPGSVARIRQCIFTRTGPEAAPGGWAIRVRYAESVPNKVARQLRMDRCTVFGHGLMELVDFSAGSRYTVHIADTAVRAQVLLSWTPAPPSLPLPREVLNWSGRGNQYDVRGKPWAVLSASETPAWPKGPTDLTSWLKIMPEEDPLRGQIGFRIDPSAGSLSARPPDFTITNGGPKPTGAEPGSVGPW